MNNIDETTQDPVWAMIEKEKRRDLLIKRISRVAWGSTLLVLSIYLILTLQEYHKMLGLYRAGVVPYESLSQTFIPFLVVFGCLSLIVAILATVGMFLRLRTTSLLEIQQRLANLENMITSEKP